MNMKINFKKVAVVLSFTLLLFNSSVYAQKLDDERYVNVNGVRLTEKEYEFVNNFYGNNFFENMTIEDYEWISDLDINNRTVEISKIYDAQFKNENLIKGPSLITLQKALVIAKTCAGSSCNVLTNLTWLLNPSNRSYDVIGARMAGVSYASNTVTTKLTSSNGTEWFTYNNFQSNGFGTSVKLPESASNIRIEQKFGATSGGTVYASYQHSTSSISQATSNQYFINSSGLGSVFSFYGNAIGKFDGMSGVNITI